jgi:hypothetical protein
VPVLSEVPYCDKFGCSFSKTSLQVSCASDMLCAATDGHSLSVVTVAAGGGVTHVESQLPIVAGTFTCPSASMCMAASAGTSQGPAEIATTNDPSDGSPRWSTTSLPPVPILSTDLLADHQLPIRLQPAISGLACASSSVCVAVDGAGGYAFVGDPAGGPWTASKIDYTGPANGPYPDPASLTGVACAPSGPCVAVDGRGYAFVGTLSPV